MDEQITETKPNQTKRTAQLPSSCKRSDSVDEDSSAQDSPSGQNAPSAHAIVQTCRFGARLVTARSTLPIMPVTSALRS
jgi:hypothetical protein